MESPEWAYPNIRKYQHPERLQYVVQKPQRRREGCCRHHLLWDSELYMHSSCHAKRRGRMLNFERGNWQSRCSRFAKRLCELRFTNNNSQHHVCYSLLTCLLAADITLLAYDSQTTILQHRICYSCTSTHTAQATGSLWKNMENHVLYR